MRSPPLDSRTRADVMAQALTLAGRNPPAGWTGYVPDWSVAVDAGDPGYRMLELFSRLAELLIERLNRMPEKNFLAFLDLAGVERFAGSPAAVPVTFVVAAKSRAGGAIPAKTQVATIQTRSSDARVFETQRAIFASKARVTQLIALHPATNRFTRLPTPALAPAADALAAAAGITVLTALSSESQAVPHELFIASETLFGRSAPVDVTIAVQYAGAAFPALLRWSRWDKALSGWAPLAPVVSDPIGGPITFAFNGLAGVGKVVVNGVEDYWLRAELDTAPTAAPLVVTSIRGVIAPSAIPEAAPDAAFLNSTVLDVTRPFAPFGTRPVYGDAFYLGSRVGFAPDNERFTLRVGIRPYFDAQLVAQFTGIQSPMVVRTVVRWEYLDRESRWRPLRQYDHEFRFSATRIDPGTGPVYVVSVSRGANPAGSPAGEGTFIGSTDGAAQVEIEVPGALDDIGLHTRHGVTSRWLRALLVSEDPYGREGVVTGTGPDTRFTGPLLIQPRVESVAIRYVPPVADSAIPRVMSLGNFEWRDHSGVPAMTPFVALGARQSAGASCFGDDAALYIGFDRPFEVAAYISLFVDLAGRTDTFSAPLESGDPHVVWEAWNGAWLPLDATDDTLHLTTSGTVSFLAPADAVAFVLAEQLTIADAQDTSARWWIRARLASGRFDLPPAIRGVYVNTVMAENRSGQSELMVGSSNGEPDQRFQLTKTPVLNGALWVREPDAPTLQELQDLTDEHRDDERRSGAVHVSPLDLGGPTGREGGAWVRWRRVPNFELSGSRSRHYILDAVSGRLAFGGGQDRGGLVPPPGRDNLVIRDFETGGGEGANHDTGVLAVRELKSSLPFIDRVFNVQPATGGSSEWTIEQLLDLGPSSLKTMGRAVTTEDYESMVLQRFSEVARARCAAVSAPGPGGSLVFKAGGVTMVIVPGNDEARPQPSAGLSRRVREFLLGSALRNIAGDVHVKGPEYVAVDIDASLVARRPELASVVERRARQALERFLHPLRGGEGGQGYRFGRPVYLSEVHAVLSRVEDVDRVISARFSARPSEGAFRVEGERLPSSGSHRIAVGAG